MTEDNMSDLGKMLKQRRILLGLSMKEVAARSGISSSHLGRVERGERSPSFVVLRKIARPLGFEEMELLTLGGFLSPQPSAEVDRHSAGQVDPYVASVLSQEPVEVQRAVTTILIVMKSLAKSLHEHECRPSAIMGHKRGYENRTL